MMFLSKNWYFSVQKALIYYTFNKSHHNSFILLVFSHVANFRYVANFRFLTLYTMIQFVISHSKPIFHRAPRFLMKQKVKIHPEHNLLYNQQKKLKPKPDPFPHPPVVSLLPLRPKTCLPRKTQPVETPREALKIADALAEVSKVSMLYGKDCC